MKVITLGKKAKKIQVFRMSPQSQVTEATARDSKDLSTGDIVSRLSVVDHSCGDTQSAINQCQSKLVELRARLRADQAIIEGFERILNARR